MICLKKKYYDEDFASFASFATRRFSTLAPTFGHVEGVGKNTRYK